MRIAVVSPLFPVPDEPQRGLAIYNTVRELARLAEVRVYCPVASYPRWRALQPRSYKYVPVDSSYSPEGVRATYFGYVTVPVAGRPLNGWLSSRVLLPRLAEFRPEVVLAYWVYPEGRGALLASRKLGAPVVVGARGSDLRQPPDPWSFRLIRRTLRRADRVLTVSEDLRQSCIGLGVSPQRVHTVPNGCDTATFQPRPKSATRAELGVRPDAEIVLFVGRLAPVKGVRDLLEAVRLLAAQRPRLELVMLGDGPLRATGESAVEEAGLGGRVRWLGVRPVQEVARWLAVADLLCLPSHSEGCPNVVLEAMACGRPVVASAVGGVPELLKPECGILVPPADPRRLGEALAEALDRPWDPAAIAARFRRGWDRVAAETYEVCRLTVEERRCARAERRGQNARLLALQ